MINPAPVTALGRAHAAWGESIPAWIVVLAEECDRTNQGAVARRLNYSAALVSNTLNNKYTGNLTAVEQAVRGALMAETLTCPVVGQLASDACLNHQRATWAPHNPQRIAFFRACRAGCPHSRLGDGHDR